MLAAVDRIASQNPSSFKVEDIAVREGNYSSTLKVLHSSLTDRMMDYCHWP